MVQSCIYFASDQYIAMLLTSNGDSALVLDIGIARGQYYWTLDIGCLAWYHSNPTNGNTMHYTAL